MNVFCTVNYLDYVATRKYIDSFLSLKLKNTLLLVVDNLSNTEDSNKLKHEYIGNSNVFFKCFKENLGYFGAAIKGFEQFVLSEKITEIDYFCISNNDMYFENGNDWEATLNKMSDLYPSLGCIAPRIISTLDHRNQNPFHINRPHKSYYLKFKLVFLNYFVASFVYSFRGLINTVRKKKTSNTLPNKMSKIYAAQGAFFIFSKNWLESVFLFDEVPFLYAEEISVAEHCRSKNLDIIYVPSLVVYHDEHSTTGVEMTKFKYKHIRKAVNYILRTYY